MFELPNGLRLRAFREPPHRDIDDILSMYNNIQVAPKITERLMVPRGQKLKDSFKDYIDKDAEMFCMIETIPTGLETHPVFVGITGLWADGDRGHRHSKFSIVLMPPFWNRGYGKIITKFMIDHAFLHLNMHRISLEVYEGNDRAEAVYKKCGFVEEGVQRKAMWVNGAWRDKRLMGILFDEWMAMRGTGEVI